jgi:hypothetical protein
VQTHRLRPVIKDLREEGKNTVREIMEELNRRGIKTLRAGNWHSHTVNVLLHRINRTKPKVRAVAAPDAATAE